MPRTKTGLKRPLVFDVRVNALEDEFILRKSLSLGFISKSAYVRSIVIPPPDELNKQVKALRDKQKDFQLVLREMSRYENLWKK
jgi:hypothetical protein